MISKLTKQQLENQLFCTSQTLHNVQAELSEAKALQDRQTQRIAELEQSVRNANQTITFIRQDLTKAKHLAQSAHHMNAAALLSLATLEKIVGSTAANSANEAADALAELRQMLQINQRAYDMQ